MAFFLNTAALLFNVGRTKEKESLLKKFLIKLRINFELVV